MCRPSIGLQSIFLNWSTRLKNTKPKTKRVKLLHLKLWRQLSLNGTLDSSASAHISFLATKVEYCDLEHCCLL